MGHESGPKVEQVHISLTTLPNGTLGRGRGWRSVPENTDREYQLHNVQTV